MRRLFQPSSHRGAEQLGHKMRIVSYNILADKYSSFNSYCPQQYLSWSYRGPRILSELESYAPDLMCLQEVEQTVFNQQLQPWMLQHGYHSLFHPRRSPPGVQGPDEGVSLHFKTSLFKHIDSKGIRFASDEASSWLPAACCQQHRDNKFANTFNQREEGALMALVWHEPSQRQLLVVSTHLFWNPLFPDVKVAQAAVMCSSIAAFLRRHNISAADVPVVIAGDFNSMWQKYSSDQWDTVPKGQSLQSGVYQLMQQGQLLPSHQDHPRNRSCISCCGSRQTKQQQQHQHLQQQPELDSIRDIAAALSPDTWEGSIGSPMDVDSRVVSESGEQGATAVASRHSNSTLVDFVFNTSGLRLDSSHYMAHGREPPLTTRTKHFSGCLDYIWLSQRHWQVSATLAMPYTEPQQAAPPESVTDLGPCPNEQYPSDHLAVGCDAFLLPLV